jgi:hypothetical protein
VSSWLGDAVGEADLLARLPGLAPALASLRHDAAADCPGRTAEIIATRARQLVTGEGSMDGFGTMSELELVVVELTEQFLLDVHGITDDLVARLGTHVTPAEQIAIMFQLAFADGFTKFRHAFGVT